MGQVKLADIIETSTEKCRNMDAPLSRRLQAFAEDVREVSPGFADTVDRMVARLEASGVGQSAPTPGEAMPDFLLPDQDGNLIGLTDLLGGGPVVLSFNRGHWCPYCRINLGMLAKFAPELEALGARLIAITPEMARFSREFRDDTKAAFSILSDIDGGYATELNLLFWVGEEKREAMLAEGFNITPFQGNETWMLPIPATFVIGGDGMVKARYIDPDYRRRMEIDDLLAAVKDA